MLRGCPRVWRSLFLKVQRGRSLWVLSLQTAGQNQGTLPRSGEDHLELILRVGFCFIEEMLKRFMVIVLCWYQQWLPTEHGRGRAAAEMGHQQLLLGVLWLLTSFSSTNEQHKGAQFKQNVAFTRCVNAIVAILFCRHLLLFSLFFFVLRCEGGIWLPPLAAVAVRRSFYWSDFPHSPTTWSGWFSSLLLLSGTEH